MIRSRPRSGWEGWDEYAPFYDWENARTLGRRDVPFWKRLAAQATGRILELGCGTGRITLPLARAGMALAGIDRSQGMLSRATGPARRLNVPLVRGDIRFLPFQPGSFSMVIAAYGILQSLLSDRDLRRTLDAVARVLEPGGRFGIDLIPDVPNWREYHRRVQLRGRMRGGANLTLIESVRQQPRNYLTTFEQCYIVRRGRSMSRHRFDLRFRTLPLQTMIRRLSAGGFEIESILGDYRGGPWTRRSETWLIVAKRVVC